MFDSQLDILFVEVILPLSLNKNYTYRVPQHLNDKIQIGKRVLVQFGKSKIYTALIYKISDLAPKNYEAKYVLDIVDQEAIVTLAQLKFWEWLSQYYMANLGDILSVALPSAFKWSSETKISLAAQHEDDISDLSLDAQTVFLYLLKKKQLSINDVMYLLERKNVNLVIRELIMEGFAQLMEEITDKFKPLKKSFISLHPDYLQEEAKRALFGILERAPKQLEVLLAFYKLSRNVTEITKQNLIKEGPCSSTALKTLIDKKVFIEEKKTISRLLDAPLDFEITFELSIAQKKALYEIQDCWLTGNPVSLLYGVTSAGKTQVYIKLIEAILEKNPKAQILFLLPEIALTTQLVERVSLYFGSKLGVYHSKFSDLERVEIWEKVKNEQYQIVLGARSALFLPFQNLALIIVDEEHENSYKQQDPAPRYQARDSAIALANQIGAHVLLGSATPSLESWQNAVKGKYGLVYLTERFGGVAMPKIELIDLKKEPKHSQSETHFSQLLLTQIQLCLDQNEQVILFQNRRGFTTVSICNTCGYTSKCTECDVSLTYHKSTGKLHCHYCGFSKAMEQICPACASVHIIQKGVGTELIEEELKGIFPKASIARLDFDSTRKKNSMEVLLADFKAHKIQILVGTQMIAKGLDFDDVTLIGVLNADSILNFPDFRAHERAYQLMAQVAGRAGRRTKQGKVMIQTFQPNHPILEKLVQYDYEGMAAFELTERNNFHYPPFQKIILIKLKHKDEVKVNLASQFFVQILKNQLAQRVLGPEAPLVARIRNQYIRHIMIKVEPNMAIKNVKHFIQECIQYFYAQKDYRSIVVQIDIDP